MQITLTLPDELAQRARAEGLLTDKRLVEMLENELDRAAALKRFGEITDALASAGMTEEEIERELQARKAERLRERDAS